jgi:hypothetical protein
VSCLAMALEFVAASGLNTEGHSTANKAACTPRYRSNNYILFQPGSCALMGCIR